MERTLHKTLGALCRCAEQGDYASGEELCESVAELARRASVDPEWGHVPEDVGQEAGDVGDVGDVGDGLGMIQDDAPLAHILRILRTLPYHLDPYTVPDVHAAALRLWVLLATALPRCLGWIVSSMGPGGFGGPGGPGEDDGERGDGCLGILIGASFAGWACVSDPAMALLQLYSLVQSGALSVDPLESSRLGPELLASCSACSICQTDVAPGEWAVALVCGHVFHRAEIIRWLSFQPSCPSCRAESWGPRPVPEWSVHQRLSLALDGLGGPGSTSVAALRMLGPRAPLTHDHAHLILDILQAADDAVPYAVRVEAVRALARCVVDNAWGEHLVSHHPAQVAGIVAQALEMDGIRHGVDPEFPALPLSAGVLSVLGSLVRFQVPLPLFLSPDYVFLNNPAILDSVWQLVPVFLNASPELDGPSDLYAASELAYVIANYAATGSVNDVLRSTGLVLFVVAALNAAVSHPDAYGAARLLAQGLAALQVMLRPQHGPAGFEFSADPECSATTKAGVITHSTGLAAPSFALDAWYRPSGLYDDSACSHVHIVQAGGLHVMARIIRSPASPPAQIADAMTVIASLLKHEEFPLSELAAGIGLVDAVADTLARRSMAKGPLTEFALAVGTLATWDVVGAALLNATMVSALEEVLSDASRFDPAAPNAVTDAVLSLVYNTLVAASHTGMAAYSVLSGSGFVDVVVGILKSALALRPESALPCKPMSTLALASSVLTLALAPQGTESMNDVVWDGPDEWVSFYERIMYGSGLVYQVPGMLAAGGPAAAAGVALCRHSDNALAESLVESGLIQVLQVVLDGSRTNASDTRWGLHLLAFLTTSQTPTDTAVAAAGVLADEGDGHLVPWTLLCAVNAERGDDTLVMLALRVARSLLLAGGGTWAPSLGASEATISLLETLMQRALPESPPAVAVFIEAVSAMAAYTWMPHTRGEWVDTLDVFASAVIAVLFESRRADDALWSTTWVDVRRSLCLFLRMLPDDAGAASPATASLLVRLLTSTLASDDGNGGGNGNGGGDEFQGAARSSLAMVLRSWVRHTGSLVHVVAAVRATGLLEALALRFSVRKELDSLEILRTLVHIPWLAADFAGSRRVRAIMTGHEGGWVMLVRVVEELEDGRWWALTSAAAGGVVRTAVSVRAAQLVRERAVAALLAARHDGLDSCARSFGRMLDDGLGLDLVRVFSGVLGGYRAAGEMLRSHGRYAALVGVMQDTVAWAGADLIARPSGHSAAAWASVGTFLERMDRAGLLPTCVLGGRGVHSAAHPASVFNTLICRMGTAQVPEVIVGWVGLGITALDRARARGDMATIAHIHAMFVRKVPRVMRRVADGPNGSDVLVDPDGFGEPRTRYVCVIRLLRLLQVAAAAIGPAIDGSEIEDLAANLELELGEWQWVGLEVEGMFEAVFDICAARAASAASAASAAAT